MDVWITMVHPGEMQQLQRQKEAEHAFCEDLPIFQFYTELCSGGPV